MGTKIASPLTTIGRFFICLPRSKNIRSCVVTTSRTDRQFSTRFSAIVLRHFEAHLYVLQSGLGTFSTAVVADRRLTSATRGENPFPGSP